MDPDTTIKDTYNQIAKKYTKRYGYSPFLLKNVKKFSSKLAAGGRVLDLGCGSGRALKLFVEKGFTVVGVDFSDAMLGFAKKLVLGASLKKMDIRQLEFPDASFDGIWSCFSLLHIPKRDIGTVLSGLRRVLKPGGLLFVAVSLGNEEEGFEDEWLKKGTKMFFYKMSKKGLVKHLKETRFSIEEIGIEIDSEENEDCPILYAYAKSNR